MIKSLISAISMPWTYYKFKRDPGLIGMHALRGLYLQHGIDPVGIPLEFTRKLAEEAARVINSVADFEQATTRRKLGTSHRIADFYNHLNFYATGLAQLQNGWISLPEFRARYKAIDRLAPKGLLERMSIR